MQAAERLSNRVPTRVIRLKANGSEVIKIRLKRQVEKVARNVKT
jgi:hypothetical protein